MSAKVIRKVLITGGHEIGGVASFAEGLCAGFTELGIPVEIIPPARVFLCWRELRDPQVLKILSTTAVYAAPLAKRAICMAHGVPRADYSGLCRMVAIIASHRIANLFRGVQVVSVSDYTAITLRAVFNIRTDAVIHNPVKPIYLEPCPVFSPERCYVTYVGRLIETKNLYRILPAIRDLLDENPGLHMCIIGEGKQRLELESLVNGDARFEFKGTPDDVTVRDWLRRTRIFVSGNEVEGFGITYVEAMAQGCIVVMPASGGGIEIALDQVGKSVQLFPLSWERGEVLATLRRALTASWEPISMASFTTKAVASSYLKVDERFSSDGKVME